MQGKENGSHIVPKVFSFFLRRMGKPRPFSMPHDLTSSRELLFIDSGDVTDLLFSAPFVNYFHRKFPDIHMSLLVHEDHAEIAKNIMKIKRLITYQPNQLRVLNADYMSLLRRFKSRKADSAVLLGRRYSLERYLIAFSSGARIRIGFEHPLAFPFINCEIRLSEDAYEGNKMARVLRSIGLRPDEEWSAIELSQRERNHAKQMIHFRKPEKDYLTVGLDPSKGKTKHHVIPEIIAYLANNLAGRRKVKFLVLMDPWDDKIIAGFSQSLKSEIIDLKPANISEAVAFLSQCDLFLSGNTNLFHFASALEVPTIGLFTKYDGPKWVPADEPKVRIFKGMRGEKLSLKSFFSKVEEVLESEVTV